MTPDDTLPPTAPAIAIQNFNGLIDDAFIQSCGGKIPFYYPLYSDYQDGDTFELWGNGTMLHFEKVPKSVIHTNPYGTFTVDSSFFDYTGLSNLWFRLTDPSRNPSLTDYQRYKVQRKKYPAPDDPSASTINAPALAPAKYSQQQFLNAAPLQVTVAYANMDPTDIVTVRFELRATTADRDPLFFYPLMDMPVQISATDASRGYAVCTVPAGTFASVDENIGRVYFTVRNQLINPGSLYLNDESHRAVFQLDVVPPHSA
ncbi:MULTISPECIES: hypothetical protein [unclassified Achromobacter]|uniref:hypothetical protein n=1 Tax=unclassified Achromobacter TaxID=2626865 RepID=UPI000B517274|nr:MULTISPECIES: hypothetical protein [unclassified Achromobacter]OWT75290.1 hypothetical protein CEY04_16915 [Achromobacter sp. HZ28]OWT75949.1 hypothetical protein CEY05_12365 [Achromobacter sp. HZ34]